MFHHHRGQKRRWRRKVYFLETERRSARRGPLKQQAMHVREHWGSGHERKKDSLHPPEILLEAEAAGRAGQGVREAAKYSDMPSKMTANVAVASHGPKTQRLQRRNDVAHLYPPFFRRPYWARAPPDCSNCALMAKREVQVLCLGFGIFLPRFTRNPMHLRPC